MPGSMSAEELLRFRDRRGLSQQQLADLLNEALGKKYTNESVRRWEKDRGPSKEVAAFLEQLQLAEFSNTVGGDDLDGAEAWTLPPPDTEASGDPLAPPPAHPVLSPTGGVFAKTCEELFDLISTGLGIIGGAVGSEAMIYDSGVIAADKKALGRAYGKLAETNDTFRKMLLSMTSGGAWVEVAMVTGGTVSKMWNGHQQLAAERRAQRDIDEPPAAVAA